MRHKRKIIASGPAVQPGGLIAIAFMAVAIIGLTFRTWVDFNVTHLRGTDADAMTSVGDGYFVIALAVLAIVCTAALYLRPSLWALLLPGVGISAVGIAAIAAYQAGTPWHASGSDIHGAFVVGGHATAAVYEVFALGALMGVVAGVLATMHYQRRRQRSESAALHAVKGPRHDQPHPGAAGRLGPR